MSSETIGLHNLDYVPRYEQVLAENLPDGFTQFADFFAGTQRLTTLAGMFDQHVRGSGLEVLNVGSGPFATEIFVKSLDGQTVLAVDYTPEFAPFHEIFRQEGHLQDTVFLQADIRKEAFELARFDLMILHDILYEQALDMNEVIARLQPALKPGGLLFFDFVNSRTAWTWRMLGKPERFRRYDPRAVRAFLADAGLDVVAWQATHGAKSLPARLVHAMLRICGASNNYAVLVRAPGRN